MKQSTRADYQRRLLRAQTLLEARLDQPVSPEELAHAASFSLHHFHRIFRAQLGESVMQHVRRLRLERAARALRAQQLTAATTAAASGSSADAASRSSAGSSPAAPAAPTSALAPRRLLDLALEAGYESHEAFTRAFTDHFGVTPSAYRDQAGRSPPPPQPVAVPVRVATFEAVPVLFRRHRGGYAGVAETWGGLLAWVRTRLAALPPLYGICPDDTEVTEEPLLRFDACVAAVPGLVADDTVHQGVVPAGTYAVGLHTGPYHRLHETYLDVIGRWAPGSGYELAPEPVVEFYVDDPSCTPEAELRTEVRVRLAD